MKTTFYPSHICKKALFFFMLFFVSCLSEPSEDSTFRIDKDEFSVNDSIAVEVMEMEEILPPPSAEKDSIIAVHSLKSPFIDIGCCQNKEKRKANCCCEEVLRKFKEMYENDDPRLFEVYSTDPILQGCRKEMRAAFEEIENSDDSDGDDW